MKENKVVLIVDELVAKYHHDRQNNLHLGFDIIESCISIADKYLPSKKIKKSGKFKIGSEVTATDTVSALRRYKIVKFYTENSVLAERSNLELAPGSGYFPTLIIPTVLLQKAKAIKLKPIKIKEGEYFTVKGNNTVYKATKVDKQYVVGNNKLQLFENTKTIKVARTGIVLSTKGDFKKQHKAEKKYIKSKKA